MILWALIIIKKLIDYGFIKRNDYYIYEKKMTLNDAVEKAVTECIRQGILTKFLTENRAEVVAMSIFEFDAEKNGKNSGKLNISTA